MNSSRISSLNGLVKLARDKSQKSRSALVTAINDLYSSENAILSEQDRVLMANIMLHLINEVEISVRRMLSEQLADNPDAPLELVSLLANDDIEVAAPILAKSEVLRDRDLVEIIQYRAMEHQVAIAMRKTVSQPVSDALVETNNEKVIGTLLSNQGAAISTETMGRLVEKSRSVSSYQASLVHRVNLSPQLAKKLYWSVSAALRMHIVDNFEIDPNDLDEAMENTVKSVFGEKSDEPSPQISTGDPSDPAAQNQKQLINSMQQGDINEFVHRFSKFSRLRLELVRRILFEEGGEGLAIVCKAIGLEKHIFLTIFLRFRSGRVGEKEVESDELSKAVAFFDQLEEQAARDLLRRWQRDPGYLNALRLVEQP